MKRDYTKDYQDRPARIQLDYRNTQPTDTGGTWNVYYSKYSGDGSRFAKGTIIPAEHRVVIDRDAGKTRASSKMPFCIHFAHGKCSRGHNCTFLHRIPMKGDRVETTIDCFGRDKFRNHREDMGGVGSFEHRTRTLYVGNVAINDHMEEICRNHFSEFGEIEYLNVLPGKGVVFIQYTHINNAEFAKEAMEGQTLESSEIINVRWASEDPNPHVVETLKRKTEETVIETIRAQLPIVGDKGTILDYEDSFKRPKVEAPVHKDISREKETQLEKGEAFYGADEDAWTTYCNEYLNAYGVYPDGSVPQTQESGSASYVVSKKAKITEAKPKLLVADYASSDDDA